MKEQKHRGRRTGWMRGVCASALICACFSPPALLADTSSDKISTSHTSSHKAKPKPKAKATQSKKPPKKSTAKAATSRRGVHQTPSQLAAEKEPLSTTAGAHSAKSKSKRARKKAVRGQQRIDSERAQAIQAALIREHYLSGTATGTWNQSCEDAMRRYQADHGWQSKTVPDARALISLGLGPSHDHLLNPESAMTTGPSAPRAAALTPASHSAEPGSTMSAPVSNPNSEASRPQ